MKAKFDNDMDKDDIDIVITKFEEYCVRQRNETFERYNFNMRVQQEGETVDSHVTALKTLAETSNFGQLQDDLLRDKIVIRIKEKGYKEKASQYAMCGNADQLESCSTTLLIYNKSEVKLIGRKKMRVLNPKNNNMYFTGSLEQQHLLHGLIRTHK